MLLLGGKSWRVLELDWDRHVARVEPINLPGRSVWLGDGAPLAFRVCRAMRAALIDPSVVPGTTERARKKLAELSAEMDFLTADATALKPRGKRLVDWWTFAGLRVNAALADRLMALGQEVESRSNFGVCMRVEARTRRGRPSSA